MGFRVNANFIRAFFAVQQDKRDETREPAPKLEMSDGIESRTISAAGSTLQQNFTVAFSGALSGALTLGAGIPSTNTSSDPRIVQSGRSESNSDRLTELLNSDSFKSRANVVVGIGDRAIGSTNTPPTENQQLFIGSTPYEANQLENDSSQPPTQLDAIQVRDTILSIAKDYVRTYSAATTDEVTDQVDSILGEGTSDLFNLRLIDRNGGQTNIEVDQVSGDQLSIEDQTTLKTAAYNSLANFTSSKENLAYTGPDFQEKFNQLQDILGPMGNVAVAELKEALSKPGDLNEAFQKLEDVAANLDLSDTSIGDLKGVLQDISDLDTALRNSYEKNTLSDGFSVSYTSGRFASAWTTEDIEATAALTNDDDFLAKIIP